MSQDWKEPLTFPSRLVYRYAEHVTPGSLEVGEVYFRVWTISAYRRSSLSFSWAEILTRASTGPASTASSFQGFESHSAGIRWGDPTQPIDGQTEEERFEQNVRRGCFESRKEAQGSGVSTFDAALNQLFHCCIRRENADK